MNNNPSTELQEKKLAWNKSGGGFSESKPVEKTEPFIAGPLPLPWINAAGNLPGRTLHVGLVLWFLAGVTKSKIVRLGSKQLAAIGVSRNGKYEALKHLSGAGLVSVDQQPGKVPVVTLIHRR